MTTRTSTNGFEFFIENLSSSNTYVLTGRITAASEVLTEYMRIATSLNNLNNDSTILSYSGESIVYRGGGVWELTDVLIFTPSESQNFHIAVSQDISATDRFSEVSLFVRPQAVKDDYPNTYRDNSVQIININNTVYGKIETWNTGSSILKDVDVFKIYLNSNTSYNLFADNNSFGPAPALAILSGSDLLVEDTEFNNLDFRPIISGYYYIYVGSDQEINYNLRVSINAPDTTAPTVSTFSPTDGLTGVAVGANIAVSFSETVKRGTGSIEIRLGSATGAIVESFDVATSTRISIVGGSTLTIDPTSNLANDTQYFVVFTAGTIKDAAGNAYTGTSTYDFTTERIDDYTFTAPGVVTIGGAATSGSIETAYDADYFRVSLTAGVTYTFNLSATSGSIDPYLGLFQGDYYLATNDNFGSSFNSQITFTAPSSGIYYLEAGGGPGVGTYSLRGTAAPADTTPPIVSSIAYGSNDGSLALGEAVTLTVTLNEAVNVTGTPTLALANGGSATYTGGTGTSTLTFSYTAAAGQTAADLATAASNALTGTIKDLAGNAVTAAGFNNVNPTGTLAVDVTAPSASTFTPTDGATAVAVGANIVLTFSENIAKGTGSITLRSGSATGTIVESFDAASSNRITVSGSTLTIDPTSNLSGSTQYFVVFTSGNIKDTAGNAYAGISTYDFTTAAPADTTPPTFTSATTSADGLKVILTYNEPLNATTAAKTAFAVKVAGAAATVNSVSVNGSTVELTLATAVAQGQAVTVGYTAPAANAATSNAAVQDTAGNDAATLTATTAVTNISTVDKTAPTVSTFTPTDGATAVAVGSNIVLTFSENIAKGSGTITLRSGSATGTIVESFDAATSNRITLSGATLTIDPTSNLSANTQYFVVFTSGNIKDSAGNAYAGISTYDFKTVNVINGTANNDTLTGTASADTIDGLAGNDVITGGAGTDVMNGGDGSDLYIIAAASEHTAAEIADNGASGTDEVRFTSATANETLTLYATDTGIEQAVIGTGTATAAVTTATTALNVNAAALSYGLTLIGNAGANTLTGGSGNDTLQGGAGNDTLVGGAGVDIADYTTATTAITLSLALTTAQNTGGAGSDTLSGIEGLSGGTAADRLTGNDSDNLLWGKAGNDTLIGAGGADQLRGGDGLDTLTGGAGADWFIFDTAANATTNKDTISDFTSGTDKLQFSKAIFTGLSGAALGDLSSDAFWSGAGITTAHDATDRFIYNTTNGALYYDADGNASGSAAVQVATLGATTPLAFTDLYIIG